MKTLKLILSEMSSIQAGSNRKRYDTGYGKGKTEPEEFDGLTPDELRQRHASALKNVEWNKSVGNTNQVMVQRDLERLKKLQDRLDKLNG